jgi:hypothetical protein
MKTTIRSFFALLALFSLFAAGREVDAVIPPPDGGYPNFNTAEGQNALFSLTTGVANTAVGWFSLRSNSTGSFNTALGAGALLANTGDSNTATGVAALAGAGFAIGETKRTGANESVYRTSGCRESVICIIVLAKSLSVRRTGDRRSLVTHPQFPCSTMLRR